MHSKNAIALATLVLSSVVQCAIVGAPVEIKNPFAIELEASQNENLAARNNDPLECAGWCWGGMHCCLFDGIYSRCHSINTPCSKLSFPDALSAPAPHPPPEISPTNAAAALADISARQDAKENRIAPRSDLLREPLTTETTLHVVTETATTVLTVPILPIPSGLPTSPNWPSQLTTGPPAPPSDQYTTGPIPYISTFTSVLPATAAPGAHTHNDSSVDTASTLQPSSFPVTLTTTFSLPSSLPSSRPQNTTESEHTHSHDHQSTVTSVTSMASATTSTASLNNEPSAIATNVAEDGAERLRVPLSAVGAVDGVLLLGLIGLGVVLMV